MTRQGFKDVVIFGVAIAILLLGALAPEAVFAPRQWPLISILGFAALMVTLDRWSRGE